MWATASGSIFCMRTGCRPGNVLSNASLDGAPPPLGCGAGSGAGGGGLLFAFLLRGFSSGSGSSKRPSILADSRSRKPSISTWPSSADTSAMVLPPSSSAADSGRELLAALLSDVQRMGLPSASSSSAAAAALAPHRGARAAMYRPL